MFYVRFSFISFKCVLFLLASFLKCFLSFKLNFLYASGFPAKKPLSLVSEFFGLIFILNFVYNNNNNNNNRWFIDIFSHQKVNCNMFTNY